MFSVIRLKGINNIDFSLCQGTEAYGTGDVLLLNAMKIKPATSSHRIKKSRMHICIFGSIL